MGVLRLVRGGLVAVVAGSLLGLVGPVGPASAVSTDQEYWVSADGRLNLRGHGYGHGHGMSQHGAQGAAQAGKGYEEIVEFYYPGTSWGKVRGKVRVLVSADTTDDVIVDPAPGLTFRDLGDGSTHELPAWEKVRGWRLVVRNGKTVVEKLTRRWHRFRPRGMGTLAGDGEFVADGPLTLTTPSGKRRYRGILRAASPSKGSGARDTVNIVTMDQYVMGVVPYEMPASWHPQAVRSQAIAARTYATWSRNQNRRRYYQICDTTSCQVYGGVTNEDARSNAAVRDTRRRILTYDGKPAFTQFSASSGGYTSKGSVPYLPSKKDPYDDWSGNTVHDWAITVNASKLENAYPKIGRLRRLLVTNREGGGDWQGRVTRAVLDGTDADVTVSGDDLRWTLGLRSTWFTVAPTPIMARWSRIGGSTSRVGSVKSGEYPSGAGSAQNFSKGRIFYSKRTGARELYGRVLRRYAALRGPQSDLGMPTTPVKRRRAGTRALFEKGAIYALRRTGNVELYGAIARRYRAAGELRSGLGWPTRTNFKVNHGQRANFENGYIRWFRKSGRTRVRRTG